MEINNKKKIKYLVSDTTAFINAVALNEYAENIFTVPDVMAEVRNKRQIKRLCVLPYDLQIREPRPDSVKHCVEYSKKTGDYISLSAIDIKIIALTYELEADHVGTEHLRKEPIVNRLVASKNKPSEFNDSVKLPGWYSCDIIHNVDKDKTEKKEDNIENEEEKDSIVEHKVENNETKIQKMIDNNAVELDINFAKLLIESDKNEFNGKIKESESSNELNADSDGEDDNEDSWITLSNIDMMRKRMNGKVESDVAPIVACISTDFAIQNTLKQMNLNVVALNGCIIRHLRTFILRCYACFKTTSVMTKIFCPNCGNKTLKKVAVSLDEEGKQVIHINTRRPLTSKYKNQSLPLFRGGKHSHNPILFEDQPMPRQMPSRVARTKTNALEENYIAGYSPFALRDVDSKSAILRSKGQLGKQWSRNTMYEEGRRRRHYNRLYK